MENATLELTWLHIDDGQSDAVVDRIWEKLEEVRAQGQFPVLHVGAFAQMPKSMRDPVNQ